MNNQQPYKQAETGILQLCGKYGGVLGSEYSQLPSGDWLFSMDLLDRIGTESMEVRGMIIEYINHVYCKDPCETIDEWLGVPFTKSLISIGLTRCQSLSSDTECCLYASIVTSGVLKRHPELDVYLKAGYMRTLMNGRKPRLIDDAESVADRLTPIAIADVMMALGRIASNHSDDGEDLWNEDDLSALDKVWWGSHSRPALMADELRKLSEQGD